MSGEPVVKALVGIFSWGDVSAELRHLFQFAKSGEKDEVWIPRIASGNWVVISFDRGKCYGGRKLPDICVEKGVTHILVSATTHKSNRFEKLRAILAFWPRIARAAQAEKGSRFYLRYDSRQEAGIVLTKYAATGRNAKKIAKRLAFDRRTKLNKPRAKRKIPEKYPDHPRFPFGKTNG